MFSSNQYFSRVAEESSDQFQDKRWPFKFNKISCFSVAIICHCGFIIKFYKTDLICSSYGHSRQLEQKNQWKHMPEFSLLHFLPLYRKNSYLFYVTSSSPDFLLICLQHHKEWARLIRPNSQKGLFCKHAVKLLPLIFDSNILKKTCRFSQGGNIQLEDMSLCCTVVSPTQERIY